MKKSRFIFLVALFLIGVSFQVVLADETVDWITSNKYANEADPEYQVSFEVATTPWLVAKDSEGIVYFVYQSPARIERFNMGADTWMPEISLSDTPTAFAVDAEGLYISFGRRTSRFNLDGTGETHLRNTNTDAINLHTSGQFIYINYSSYSYGELASADKNSGTLIDSQSYLYDFLNGSSIAPNIGMLFARTSGISPSDIVQVILNPDGTLGTASDSPYHGDYPSANKTFVFPGEARVADNSGIVYNTNNLTYANSLGGSFDDLTFYGDLPIVLRNGSLVAYSNTFLETGHFTPAAPPLRIFVNGDYIYCFSDGDSSIDVLKVHREQLALDEPGQPVDPNGLKYFPDAVQIGKDEIVYFLSSNHLSIFRWSITERKYLETIPLIEAPEFMAYSEDPERLFLSYPSGKITSISLNLAELQETPFVNSPQEPCGLSTAGEYLFVCDPSGAWVSHFTYNITGTLVSLVDWNYYSREYTWSETNRKMYFLRDDTSPNDLLWEDIGEDGVIGTKQDSPYHDSTGISHPIRVAPDGSIVLLGSGRVYNALSLEQVDSLSNSINDAAWKNTTLFTIRSDVINTQGQKWGTNYSVQSTLAIDGSPIRIFPISEGLLVITHFLDKPWFSILDTDFNIIYQDTLYYTHLPLVYHDFCPDFFDDFSNVQSGWPIDEDSYVKTEYLNGEYRVQSKQDGFLFLFRAPTCDRENYTVSVDARWAGSPGSSYGLIFGLSDDFSNYYLFDVNTDYQQFRFYRRSSSGFSQIVAPTYASAINTGSSSNHLEVSRNGSQITLLINGSVLGTWYDSVITGKGGVGLVSSPYLDYPVSDARFDNFYIANLVSSSLISQSSLENAQDACNLVCSPIFIEPINDLDW